jgi:hypothetical protein
MENQINHAYKMYKKGFTKSQVMSVFFTPAFSQKDFEFEWSLFKETQNIAKNFI